MENYYLRKQNVRLKYLRNRLVFIEEIPDLRLKMRELRNIRKQVNKIQTKKNHHLKRRIIQDINQFNNKIQNELTKQRQRQIKYLKGIGQYKFDGKYLRCDFEISFRVLFKKFQKFFQFHPEKR